MSNSRATALARERRASAVRDAEILQRLGPDPDLAGLGEHVLSQFVDLD